MNINLIGQGFDPATDETVGDLLWSSIPDARFTSMTLISAFASESAIYGYSALISANKSRYNSIKIIVGIDLMGTSKEALDEIEALGVDSFVFYQKEAPIFHPKIYLFEGASHIRMILGSSNFTGQGLFVNTENSIVMEFPVSDLDGQRILSKLKSNYSTLFNSTDPNLFPITASLITDLVSKRLVPDETTRRALFSKVNTSSPTVSSSGLSIPSRRRASLPSTFPRKSRSSTRTGSSAASVSIPSTLTVSPSPAVIPPSTPVLLWQSGPLTQRDLNIPLSPGTNATGSMLFKKGLMTGIDQRHHFRNNVFNHLPWAASSSSPHLEKATAFFTIIINGVSAGTFPLILTHNTNITSIAYRQNNSMTSLSWGAAKSHIANSALIGHSATLYNVPGAASNQFVLKIA